MYSIYAPGKTALNVADAGAAAALLGTPQVLDFVASAVQANAHRKGYIVSRTQSANRPDLVDISITLVDYSGDMTDLAYQSRLREIIATWARRSRVAGVSGDRVAVVGPLEKITSSALIGADMYNVQIRLGTAVFFNDRRVTVNFAQDKSEFTLDLVNLLDHLGGAGAIGVLNGVVIEHDEFGRIESGNTDTPAQSPQLVASTGNGSTAATGGSNGCGSAPSASAGCGNGGCCGSCQNQAPISETDLEQELMVLRVTAAGLAGRDRAGIAARLRELMARASELLEVL